MDPLFPADSLMPVWDDQLCCYDDNTFDSFWPALDAQVEDTSSETNMLVDNELPFQQTQHEYNHTESADWNPSRSSNEYEYEYEQQSSQDSNQPQQQRPIYSFSGYSSTDSSYESNSEIEDAPSQEPIQNTSWVAAPPQDAQVLVHQQQQQHYCTVPYTTPIQHEQYYSNQVHPEPLAPVGNNLLLPPLPPEEEQAVNCAKMTVDDPVDFKLPASKTPIMEAMVVCALNNWGLSVVKSCPTEVIFQVSDFDRYYRISRAICSKHRPTEDIGSRVKSLRRWFINFPKKKDRQENPNFLLSVKPSTCKKVHGLIERNSKLLNAKRKGR